MHWFSLELFLLLTVNAGLKLILDILGVIIIIIIITTTTTTTTTTLKITTRVA